jgi:hypothetical protein
MLRTLSRLVLILALAVAALTQAHAMSSPAVVYESANGRIVVFQTGDGHLYDWYWDGTQWIHAEDQGPPPGTWAHGTPAAAYQAGMDRLVAFVIGDNGRLYARYWSGMQWKWQDLSNPGVRLSGTPSAVYFQSVNQVMVFAIGVDGHLYDLMWNIVTTEWEDVSTFAGGQAILAKGSPSAAYKPDPNQVSVFVTSISGSLYNFSWDGTNWRWRPLGLPSGMPLSGDPSAIYRARENRFYAFVLGVNGMLYDVYLDAETQTWEHQDYPQGATAVGSPSAVYETAVDGIAVFVEGTDGRVYVRRMNSPSRPSTRDRIIALPPTSPSRPPAMQPILQDVWTWTNLDLALGVAKAENVPGGFYYPKSGGLMVFVQAEQHLYDAYQIGATWYWEDQGLSPDVHIIDNGSVGIPVSE